MNNIRREVLIAGAVAAAGLGISRRAISKGAVGISREAAAIHQEPVFAATRQRVFEALTDARLFSRVVELSAAMQGVSSKVATELNASAGSAFALFGGYVTGRQVKLVPDSLIVQAWRAGSWDPGLFSIAHFALVEYGQKTKIIFDQGGLCRGRVNPRHHFPLDPRSTVQ